MAPPRTVGSWAETRHSTPSTTPIPTIEDAPTGYSVPQAASGRELEEGRVAVEEQLDPLPGQELAPLPVPGHVALAAAGPGRRQLLVDDLERLDEGALVGPEGLRARVDGGGEDGHGVGGRRRPGRQRVGVVSVGAGGSGCRVARSRRRGKNRPMNFAPRHGWGPTTVGAVREGRPVVIRTYPQGAPVAPALDAPAGRRVGREPGRRLSAVVLAAGEGTRMRSARPKPLHRLCGRPMVLHVLDALAELSVARVVVVVGHRAEWVTKTLIEHAPAGMAIEFVEQVEQRGTGDAMSVALTGLPDDEGDDDGDVVVLPGDTPLLRPATLAGLVRQHRATGAAATLLTAVLDDPTGYGRVVRGRDDTVARVVEHGDAVGEELDVHEINTSIYCFRRSVLAPSLRRLSPANAQGEYYLTDVVGVLYEAGHRVGSLVVEDPMEVAGVNDRAQLAVAEAELRDRINERWMRRGVTMWDPERTYIDVDVVVEPDVVLLPGVILQGACVIGAHAEIGPDAHLVDTVVGEGAAVASSVCRRSVDRRRRPRRALRRPRGGGRGAGGRGGGCRARVRPGCGPAGRRRRRRGGLASWPWSSPPAGGSNWCRDGRIPSWPATSPPSWGWTSARPTSASSPTARSTAASTRRSGGATSSSSRPTAAR